MKELAALFSILWRATLLFPLAVAFYALVLAWLLLLPELLLIDALNETSWAWAGLAAWGGFRGCFQKTGAELFPAPQIGWLSLISSPRESWTAAGHKKHFLIWTRRFSKPGGLPAK